MNYLVTGGAGFIGSHLAEYLINRGHGVTVIDNLATGNMGNIQHLRDNPHFHFVQGSITDPGLLKDTFMNADGIFHQAAIPSVPRSIKDPVATNDVNVNGTLGVLVAAKECGVKKVHHSHRVLEKIGHDQTKYLNHLSFSGRESLSLILMYTLFHDS